MNDDIIIINPKFIKIYSIKDLQNINNNLIANYILMNDLDARSTHDWNKEKGFVPIGTSVKRFTGHFNGNGKTISNLFVNRPEEDYIGLFGATGGSQQVTDLSLVNVDITGNNFVGGLVGNPDGIYNTFSRCMTSGNIIGRFYVGGFVGSACGCTYSDSYSHANVNASGAGMSLVGGFAGSSGASYKRCYSTGKVKGILPSGFGWVASQTKNCFWDTESSGISDANPPILGKITKEMMLKKTFTNFDFKNVWDIREGKSYPKLRKKK